MAKSFERVLEEGRTAIQEGSGRLRPGVLLVGPAQGGKTSLIAALLDEDVGTVEDMEQVDAAGFPTFAGRDFGTSANYMDSPGHSTGDGYDDFSIYWDDLQAAWAEQDKYRPLEKPHVVWYCIPASQKKVGRYDYKALRKLRDEPSLSGRVAAVITKADLDKGGSGVAAFKDALAQNIADDLPVYRVSVEGRTSFELGNLVEWSVSRLTDEDRQEAFEAEQMRRLKRRRRKARKAIHNFELTTGSLGTLHRWDTETLTAAQCTLARRIIHLYGLDDVLEVRSDALAGVVSAAMDESLAGKVLRRAPIVDALSRECCAAGIAVQITRAIGGAISRICYERCRSCIHGEQVDMGAPLDPEKILAYARLEM